MTYKRSRKKNKWPARLKSLAIAIAIVTPIAGGTYFFVFYEPSLTDQQYFDNAQQHHQSGESRVAIIELKNAIKTNPNNKEARFLLGKIYLELEQGAAAEKELERSAGFRTDPRELKRMLAQAKLLQGKPKEALDELTSNTNESTQFSYQENLLIAQAHFDMREWANSTDAYNLALTQRQGSIEATVALARIAFIKGDIAIAKTHLDNLAERANNNWRMWSLRGDIARTKKQLAVAKEAYQQAFGLKANAIEPRLFHAMIALSEESFDEAKQDAKILLTINPKHPAGHYIQGQLHLNKKRLKEAQSSFEEAIRYIDYVPVFRQLGITHFQQGNLVQAEEYLKKYITLAPRDIDAQKVLSAIYVKQNKLDDAKSTLKSVASEATLNEPLQRMMAGLEQATGEPEKATDILNDLLGKNPESLETRLQLAQTLLRQGEAEQALKVLTEADNNDSASVKIKLLIVSAQLQLKKYEAALAVSKQIKLLEPDNQRFSSIDGLIYLASGNQQEAIKTFEQSQAKYPGDIISGNQLGTIAIRAKQYEKAKNYYESILAHNESHLRSQIQLGLIEKALKHPEQAQKILEGAIQAHPQNPRPKLVLARYYLVDNKPQKALNWLGQITENGKQSPNYLLTLGQAYLLNRQPEQATDALIKLNTIKPTPANYWLEAKARFLQKDLKGSREALLKAKKLGPDNIQGSIDSALFEILVTETEIAIQQKDNVVAKKGLAEIKNHQNPLPYLVLRASFEQSKGNLDTSAEYYQKALDKKPQTKIMASLLRVLTQSGHTVEAEKRARQWLETHPEDYEIAMLLANTLLNADRTAETIQHYEKLLPKQPDNLIVLNNLAFLYIDSDLEKAAQHAEKAYKLAPKFPAVVDTYGWIALKQGQHRKALNALSKAHTLDPDEPSIQYHLAAAQAKNDKKLAAIKLLRELSEKDFPEKPEADALLSSLEWKPE